MKVLMELARTCYDQKVLVALLNLQAFDHALVPSLCVRIGHRNKSECCLAPNRILCKAADLNRHPGPEKGICSDSNETAQLLQMA